MLTLNRERVLSVIRQSDHPLSVAEIQNKLGFRSPLPVQACLEKLLDAGLIKQLAPTN